MNPGPWRRRQLPKDPRFSVQGLVVWSYQLLSKTSTSSNKTLDWRFNLREWLDNHLYMQSGYHKDNSIEKMSTDKFSKLPLIGRESVRFHTCQSAKNDKIPVYPSLIVV